MRRREFFGLLGSMVAAWPHVARAQQPTIPVIGYLDTASASTTAHLVAAFREGLAAAGYEEGRNVLVEYRWPDGDYDKLPSLAADLVRRNVAVIATINTPPVLAAKEATRTILIVFAVGVDPIKFGLVEKPQPSGRQPHGLNPTQRRDGSKTSAIAPRTRALSDIDRATRQSDEPSLWRRCNCICRGSGALSASAC